MLRRLAWRTIRVGTRRYFPFCVAAVFILDPFAVLLDSLFGSDWKWMFVVRGARSRLRFLAHGTTRPSLMFVVRGARSRLLFLITHACLVLGAASNMTFFVALVCSFACVWRFDLLSCPPLAISVIR